MVLYKEPYSDLYDYNCFYFRISRTSMSVYDFGTPWDIHDSICDDFEEICNNTIVDCIVSPLDVKYSVGRVLNGTYGCSY